MSDVGYVAAGYAVTALALGGYVGLLMMRARKARLRAAAIARRGSRAES